MKINENTGRNRPMRRLRGEPDSKLSRVSASAIRVTGGVIISSVKEIT